MKKKGKLSFVNRYPCTLCLSPSLSLSLSFCLCFCGSFSLLIRIVALPSTVCGRPLPVATLLYASTQKQTAKRGSKTKKKKFKTSFPLKTPKREGGRGGSTDDGSAAAVSRPSCDVASPAAMRKRFCILSPSLSLSHAHTWRGQHTFPLFHSHSHLEGGRVPQWAW